MSFLARLMILPASLVIVATAPCEAFQNFSAHLLCDITLPEAAENLRSTSLANCKQLLVGHASSGEQILRLTCSERDEHNPTNMNTAILKLGQVDGVRRVTVLVVTTGE
jgi:hypothetical protein